MALLQKLVHGSALGIADQGAKVLLMFVTTPLMVASLGQRDYGFWLLSLTIISYFALLDLGLSFSGVRYLGRALGSGDLGESEGTAHDIRTIYRRISAATALLTLATVLAIPHFLLDPVSADTLCLLTAGFGLITAFRFWTSIDEVTLKSHVRYDVLGLASILRSAAQGAMIIPLLLSGRGLILLLAAHIISEILYRAVLFAFARKTRSKGSIIRSVPNKDRIRRLLRFGASSMTIRVGRTLRNGIDPLIVGRVTGVASIPIYNIGTRFFTLFADLINTIFGGNLFAAFSQLEGRGDREGLNQKFLSSIRVCSAVAIVGSAALLIFGPTFIERWVGPQFSNSGRVIGILAIPTGLWLAQMPASSLLLSLSKHHFLAILTIIGGALNLVLSLILAIQFGFFGVIWGTAAELTLAWGLAVPFIISKTTGINLSSYSRTILSPLAKMTPPIIAFHWLTKNLVTPDYTSLTILTTSYLLVVSPLIWFAILKKHERHSLVSASIAKIRP